MSSDLMELNKIWDTFFFPVLDSVIAYAFFLALFGRKEIIRFGEHLFPKKDGKYCRKVYQLSVEGKLTSSYAPISEDFMDLLHKPIPLIVICLIGCLAFYRLLAPLSLLFPIQVSGASTSTLLSHIDDRILAEVWSQYPNLNLDELIVKVGLNRQASEDYSYIGEFAGNIDLVVKFCASVSFIRLIFCTVCFLAIALVIAINFFLYLVLSLPLIFKFVTRYAFRKLPAIAFPRFLKAAYSSLMQMRTDLHKIFNKALLSCFQKLLSAIRALLLSAIFVLLFFLSSFQIINAAKNQMVNDFLLEKITESEKYIVSDETLNEYLQKIHEVQNEQNNVRFHFTVALFLPGYGYIDFSPELNFYDFPPVIEEFILTLENG